MSETNAKDGDGRPTGLALMREPFPARCISRRPKPTKKQMDELAADHRKGIRCKECGGWHHRDAVHVDYVGHAALTDRLLDCDPNWNWEPVATDDRGIPLLDAHGGMWIRLTVCGQTRLGYGHPDGKKGGDAIKETIGDCLRNAAMRFGAALELWHRGDLHGDDAARDGEDEPPAFDPAACRDRLLARISKARTKGELTELWVAEKDARTALREADAPKHAEVVAAFKMAGDAVANADLGGDEIPY